MPIPKPKPEENESEFVSRCMRSLNTDYPDEKQRAAICYDAYKKEKSENRWSEAVKKFIEKLSK